MGYFFKGTDDDVDSLCHHQILGAKWGHKNGPPYPLGSGDHSTAEKSAAKAAGVSVGKDSGKGSIDKLKKKKKTKPLTPEEKRQQALDAAKAGDKKKIAKNIDDLSTEELRDAAERARLKEQLTKKDPSEVKISKADADKQAAIRSGDKEIVKQYASKMTTQELRDAMDKVELMAKLNYVPPSPTAMDRIKKMSESVENFRQAAERGINAYNLAAKVYNSTHKDGTQWPIIQAGNDKPKEKSQEEKTAEALAKALGKDVAKTAKENNNNNNKTQREKSEERSHKEISDEKLKNDTIDYENSKKLEEKKEKIDKKYQERAEKRAEKEAAKEAKKNPQPVEKLYLSRLSDYDDDFSYEDLITDEVRDVMNRKVS